MINQKIKELEFEDPVKNADISNRYNNWITNISKENKQLFKKIFCDIKYISEQNLHKILQNLFLSLNPNDEFLDNTLILYIESQESKVNSSHVITDFLAETNNIAKNVCSLKDLEEKGYTPQNILLCDDFIGTGTTVIDFIKTNYELLHDKKIYLLTIHCMNKGKDNILSYAQESSLDVNVYSFENSKKYLTDENPQLLQTYLEECKKLNIFSDQLGYFDSESIVVLYRNTPNNTLGAIWKDAGKNSPIFPRTRTHIPKCRTMKKEKSNRRLENYLNGTKN